MFQKDGLLCSHILRVLLQLNIGKIHDKYFIDRWRKKENKLERRIEIKSVVDNSTLRFNILSRRFADLASQGSKSEGSYDYLMEELTRLQSKLNSNSNQYGEQHIITTESSIVAQDYLEAHIQDPDITQKKGRPTKRFKTIGEKVKCAKTKKYQCRHCRATDHTFARCPFKNVELNLPKKNMQQKTNMTTQGTVRC